MKKILYLLICLPLIFSSCKKEDASYSSSGSNTSGSILGTWEIASSTGTSTQGYLDPVQGTEVVTSIENNSENYPTIDGESHTWTFKYDGGFTMDDYYNDTLMNNSFEASYVKEGNNLSLYIDSVGDGPTYTITTLTNSTLILSYSNSNNYIENDTTYFYNSTGSLTWNKSNKKIDSSIQSQNKTGKTPFFKQFIDRRKNK